MSEQIHKKSTTGRPAETTQHEGAVAPSSDKLKADIDDLLDEIDSVLEENAEEFVRNYIQKGGE